MEKKLQEILKNTAALFWKFGIKSLTMTDIARENMIAKKTLYTYVSDKANLVEKVLKYRLFETKGNIKDAKKSAKNAVEEVFAIQKVLLTIIEGHNPSIDFDLRKYYPLVYHRITIEKSKELYEEMKSNIERGKKEGLFLQDIDADLIAKSRVLFQTQRVDNEVVSFKDFSNTYALKHMVLYHMRAVCTPKGMEIVNKEIKSF